ncbi:hypothetical protein PR202_gb05504 [Eleusine coracana subsp. coracana]|uniref:Extra-large G-protein-like n=1 Tax=Eleusine coracana subsp. coracana TaxID=191504 RepID=A0AAV5E753_ELECO|nr:hypothetical protein PR202_gb05504 [Eleusine coracana subsp. coracana]
MGSDLKEMKYRRRIGMEERPQCIDPRGVDLAALQQDPLDLLRKLDELRDQITRSCHVVGPPREQRRVSRRTASLIPEQPEPPPLAGYHRSRYGGQYGHGLPPSPYSPARPEHGERYVRQSSGHYRQFPGRQWENNGGIGPSVADANGKMHIEEAESAAVMQINTDFADDNSLSSTISRDRTEKECGSSRSIQSKADDLSFSPSRSIDVGSPKDILCERDADCKEEPSVDCPISLHSPVLEDKLVDPLCTQEKDNSGEDQGLAYRLDLTSKGKYNVNDGESISIGGKQKDVVGDTNATEDESSCKNHEQKSKEDNCCNLEDDRKMYEQDSGKKDDTGCLEDGIEKYERTNKIYDSDNTNVEHMSKNNEQKSEGDGKCVLEVESINNNGENSKEDANSALESASRSQRCEEVKMEEDDGKLQQTFVEDASSLEESGSSVNGRTNSGFSRGSSETGLDEDQSSTGKSGDSSFFAGFLKKGFKDLSLFNQSMDNVKVSINGHPISERALKKAEKKAGPVEPGLYWYDYRAGFWGVMGRECIGIIPPFIREFNYPMARNCAGGDTDVLVNGRELHQRDLDLLVGRGLPRVSGKSYSIEISGNITDEATGKKLRSLGKLAPT